MHSPATMLWKSPAIPRVLRYEQSPTGLIPSAFEDSDANAHFAAAALECEKSFFAWFEAVDVKSVQEQLIACFEARAYLEGSFQLVFHCEHSDSQPCHTARISVFVLSMPQVMAWADRFKNPERLPNSVAESKTLKVNALLRNLNPQFTPSFNSPCGYGLRTIILPKAIYEKGGRSFPTEPVKDRQDEFFECIAASLTPESTKENPKDGEVAFNLLNQIRKLQAIEPGFQIWIIIIREGPFSDDSWGGVSAPGSSIASLTKLSSADFEKLPHDEQDCSATYLVMKMLGNILHRPMSPSSNRDTIDRYAISESSPPRLLRIKDLAAYKSY